MKYALVNNKRAVAEKGAKGICPCCKSDVIPKCGQKKADHWAHKSKQDCDSWREGETPWHRMWKDYFPEDWQEVVHRDGVSGEKHVADVNTNEGWVIEVQHSPIHPDERISRNEFYKKIVWVVDGTRLKRDWQRFEKMLQNRIQFPPSKIPTFAIDPNHQCNLVEDWHDENAFVLFDFQQVYKDGQPMLWLLFPKKKANDIILSQFPKKEFITLHLQNDFDEFFSKHIPEVQKERSRLLNVYRRTNRVNF